MNIGVDIRSLMTPERTGVGEYTYGLMDALCKLDHDNQYFLFYNSFVDVLRFIPRWDQANVHYVAMKWPNKLFHSSLFILKRPFIDHVITTQQKNKLEVESCNNVTIQPRKVGLPTTGQAIQPYNHIDFFFAPNLNFTAISPSTKFILTVHDLSFEFFKDCFSWKQRAWHRLVRPRQQCERADIVLTPSENTRRDVIRHFGVPDVKVHCVYPGIVQEHNAKNKEQIIKKYNLPENFILFLGTIEPRKNIEGIIEAYKKSSLFTDHCSLVIAGANGWGDAGIRKLIRETPGVSVIGYIAPEHKSTLYRLARVFVYPSLYEGFGLPVVEAMAAGVPVVTSNRSSLPEVTAGAAYLVNPYNISEIAEGMRLLEADERARQFYVSRGLEQAKKFTWENTARGFLALLKI